MNGLQKPSEQGVTLLEIMLVLAIAAMIILMSVRYYKNSTEAEEAGALVQQFNVIAAAADTISQGSTGYGAATTANIENALGGASYLNTPWGTLSIGPVGTTGFSIAFPGAVDAGVCSMLSSELTANPRWSAFGAGCTTVTYNSTQ